MVLVALLVRLLAANMVLTPQLLVFVLVLVLSVQKYLVNLLTINLIKYQEVLVGPLARESHHYLEDLEDLDDLEDDTIEGENDAKEGLEKFRRRMNGF